MRRGPPPVREFDDSRLSVQHNVWLGTDQHGRGTLLSVKRGVKCLLKAEMPSVLRGRDVRSVSRLWRSYQPYLPVAAQ